MEKIFENEVNEIKELLDAAGSRSISAILGNKGKYCTLSRECMPGCNF